jgi:asparagine synthase (glutamine-hydrolysing)
MRAIAALLDDRTVDATALAGYLCLNYVPGDHTLLKGVDRLSPATWMLFSASSVQSERYWYPPSADQETKGLSVDRGVAELRTLIDNAIHICLRSDVPVALFLSGGIDSSIIAESAVRQGKIQHAYCLDFTESGFSELSNAAFVARKLGIELRRATLSAKDLTDFLSLAEHTDDPLADSSALAVWALSREVGRDYKVVMTGDGGDELFGGYLTYQATMLHAFLAGLLPRSFRRVLASASTHIPVSGGKVSTSYKLMRFLRAANLSSAEAHFTWNGSWLPSQVATLLRAPHVFSVGRDPIQQLVARLALSSKPSLAELQRADISEYLPNDILAKVDRVTMAHGLESRAPFLNPSLAEYALQLPSSLKVSMFGKPKRILRAVAASIYGSRIAGAKKQGFSIPVHRWLRGPGRDLAETLLDPRELSSIELLDTDAVSRAKDSHMRGQAQLGFEIWGLMVLSAWYRSRIVRASVAGEAALRRIEIPIERSTLAVPTAG